MRDITKKLVENACMPASLGTSFDNVLRLQAAWHHEAPLQDEPEFAHIFRNPTTSGETRACGMKVGDPTSWKPLVTERAVYEWLISMTLRSYGSFAEKLFGGYLNIIDLENPADLCVDDDVDVFDEDGSADLAADEVDCDVAGHADENDIVGGLVDLAKHDRSTFIELTNGDPEKAFAMIPSYGYFAGRGRPNMLYSTARTIFTQVTLYRSAGNLLRIAEEQNAILCRPTGHSALDYYRPGVDRKIHGVTGDLNTVIGHFRDVEAIYLKVKGKTAISWPGLDEHRPKQNFATEAAAEKFIFKLGLTIEGQIMEKVWRHIHGDDLERFVEKRMAQASYELRHLWRHVRFRHRKYNQNVHMANARGGRPRVVVYLACHAAWTRHRSYDRREIASFGALNDIQRALDTHCDGGSGSFSGSRDETIKKGTAGELCPPKAKKQFHLDVRELFHLLNNTVLAKHKRSATSATSRDQGTEEHSYEAIYAAKVPGPGALKAEPFVCEVSHQAQDFYVRYRKHQPNRHALAAIRAALGPIELQLRSFAEAA